MVRCTLSAQARHDIAEFSRARGGLLRGARWQLVAMLCTALCMIAGSASAREVSAGGAQGAAELQDAGADNQDASVEIVASEARSLCDGGLPLCPAVQMEPRAAEAPPRAPARRVSADGSLEDDDAPMCDRDARCIGGNIEVPELDHGHFAALPCDTLLLLLRTNASAPDRHRSQASATVGEDPRPSLRLDDRMQKELLCGRAFTFSQQASALLCAAPLSTGLAERSGHPPGIYRPPSA